MSESESQPTEKKKPGRKPQGPQLNQLRKELEALRDEVFSRLDDVESALVEAIEAARPEEVTIVAEGEQPPTLDARLDQLQACLEKIATNTGQANDLKEFGLKRWEPSKKDMRKYN